MVRRRVAPAAAALAAALLALAACSNPIDFNAEVEDKVMTAKDMYLEVAAVSPAANSGSVNPSASLVIRFDRGLDTASIAEAAILIAPSSGGTAAAWSWSYNEATRELTVQPAMLESDTPYTISLPSEGGLAGDDESFLRDAYSWSFTTADLPGGSLLIDGGATYTTNDSRQVTLSFSWNAKTDKMRYSTTAFAAADLSPSYVGVSATVSSFPLAAAEGAQTVYYQFYSDDDDTESDVLQASIIVDTVHPAAPTLTVSSATYEVPTWSWTAGGGGNGAFQYSYNGSTTYADITSTSYTRTSASSFPYGATRTLAVRERDDAGNWSDWSSTSSFGPTTIYPLSGATSLASSFTFRWPTASNYRRILIGTSPKAVTTVLAEGLTTDAYAVSGLASSTTYYWRIQVYLGKIISYTSPIYNFKTTLIKL